MSDDSKIPPERFQVLVTLAAAYTVARDAFVSEFVSTLKQLNVMDIKVIEQELYCIRFKLLEIKAETSAKARVYLELINNNRSDSNAIKYVGEKAAANKRLRLATQFMRRTFDISAQHIYKMLTGNARYKTSCHMLNISNFCS